jgi:hypothetical protein
VLCTILHDAFRWNAGQPYAFYATHKTYLPAGRCSAGTRKRIFCNDLKAPNYTNAAVAPLANSRRVNHFAAGVLLGYGIYLPGFGRWRDAQRRRSGF